MAVSFVFFVVFSAASAFLAAFDSPAESSLLLPPFGLRLESRFFLDLLSDLLVPLITLLIFCTVLSVIDSALDSLGDLASPASPAAPSPSPSRPPSPPRKELDLRSLAGWGEALAALAGWGEGGRAGSLARAPSSLAPVGGVLAWPPVAALPDSAARILVGRDCCWGRGGSSSCSGPSSGMVGWLSDLEECFLWWVRWEWGEVSEGSPA